MGEEIDAGGTLDVDAMLAHLDKWCAANPLNYTTSGMERMIRDLSGPSLTGRNQ
ncbi:hypothetical protein J7E70_29860 [Variovorax paradoxus]|nr:hypothetical protein [Variovorax paradoxus]MBT2304631.1 hypothetical protein [Variovorax paradoxus]